MNKILPFLFSYKSSYHFSFDFKTNPTHFSPNSSLQTKTKKYLLMVRSIMKWRPWLPISSKKFAVKLVVQKIKGFDPAKDGIRTLMAEVRWKGPKLGIGLRKTVKNCTKEVVLDERIGVLEWNEEFENVCGLILHKENEFCPCEIEIRVFNVMKQGFMKKTSLVGTASLDLANFASTTNEDIDLYLQLSSQPNVVSPFSLYLTIKLSELGNNQVSIAPFSSSSEDSSLSEKDDYTALKSGFKTVTSLKDLLSLMKAKKIDREEGSEGGHNYKDEVLYSPYPFDNNSVIDVAIDSEIEEEEIIKSFSYGPLSVANYFRGLVYEQESLIYFSYNRLNLECSSLDDMAVYGDDNGMMQSSKRSILPWKKRKLSLRSPKMKGEPLLKEGNQEVGGDDIDYDRRLLHSSDDSLSGLSHKMQNLSQPEFGDDIFRVGSWELKEVASRDNKMKLRTKVFFASIDQRSEQAAGESACTSLVAVIADWFQSNPNIIPNKSQFDSLIREGSLEWRNLCENEEILDRFPDKHFDLETVLNSKIRSLSLSSEKSFIGFFHPECTEEEKGNDFEFLHGAMSFEDIWDEISKKDDRHGSVHAYIVSWNDHFFVLLVDIDVYYIIDTLGERLYEGCNQAYILKFDSSTVIYKNLENSLKQENDEGYIVDEEMVCEGKEACKEYIKSFLAAIPIRELQIDIKKGLKASTHQRLQIEFHYTELAEEESKELVVVNVDVEAKGG